MQMSKISKSGSALRIAIAGAGTIGLSCGFELARRGHTVTCFDSVERSASASWAAAGMLAPAYESWLHRAEGGQALLALAFESAQLWPNFAASVQKQGGLPLAYRTDPTLVAAISPEDIGKLEHLHKSTLAAGNEASWVNPEYARARLGLSPSIKKLLALPTDHQVDNRKLLKGLRKALENLGAVFVQRNINSLRDAENAVGGKAFDAVIWARGQAELVTGYGVKGQALSLLPVEGVPGRTIRFGSGYIVPKPDRIVIGATSEENFSHDGVEPATIEQLHAAACEIMPGLKGAKRLETWSGIRPRSADGRPLIGQRTEREFVAAAHFRNGILLSPVTAMRIADAIEGRPPAADAEIFRPKRESTVI